MGGGISEVAGDERSSATTFWIYRGCDVASGERKAGKAAAHSATSGAMSQNVSALSDVCRSVAEANMSGGFLYKSRNQICRVSDVFLFFSDDSQLF